MCKNEPDCAYSHIKIPSARKCLPKIIILHHPEVLVKRLLICCSLKIGIRKIFTEGAAELCCGAWELLKLAFLSKPVFAETTSSVFPDLLVLNLLQDS